MPPLPSTGTAETRPGSTPAVGNPHKWVVCGLHSILHVASYRCPRCRWGDNWEDKHSYAEAVAVVRSGANSTVPPTGGD